VTDLIDRIAAPEPTALERMTHAETLEAVRAAVQSLPAAYREAIVLCELEEVDYASAAQAMQVPIGTVRSRVHRARALLATKLSANPSRADLEVRRAT
jgi:RNA polymerase sigma-70 factor (ECF subfamily)